MKAKILSRKSDTDLKLPRLTGKLFLIGRKSDSQLIVHERTFNRCMGLHWWSIRSSNLISVALGRLVQSGLHPKTIRQALLCFWRRLANASWVSYARTEQLKRG